MKISVATYNELGQLTTKNIGQITDGFLQTVSYRYNIRGWLKSINQLGLPNNALFGMEINYQEPSSEGLTIVPRYNGDITAIKWQTTNRTKRMDSTSTNL